MRNRPWTRVGVLTVGGHLAYELVCGVGVPLASRAGVTAATTGYLVSSVAAYRAAGRLPSPCGDRQFAVVNGLFTSAMTPDERSCSLTPHGRKLLMPGRTRSDACLPFSRP